MSIFSAHDMLASFGVELSPVLVAEASARRLRGLCAKLPYLGGSQYVECRLGRGAPPAVDFLISVSRVQREALGLRIEDLVQHGPGFDALARMLRAWTDRRSHLHEAVAAIWLEFDGVDRDEPLAANVCPSVVPSYVDPFVPLTSQAPPELLQTLCECLAVIREQPCTAAEERALRRCVWDMPQGAHWIHLSVMSHRRPPALKLYGVFPEGALIEYLEALHWPGDFRALETLLARYCPTRRTAGVLYVDLSVTELIREGAAGLGICFSQQQVRGSLERDPHQRALLSALVEDELCTPDQAAALATWPRSTPITPTTGYALEQWLDVKLVLDVYSALSAKAYLGFGVGARKVDLFGNHPRAVSDKSGI